MSNITIGRYGDGVNGWSGWVEGTDASGQRWIMYLDDTGRPSLYWSTREPSGAVVGAPVEL